jgi:hypothetical protein
VRNRVRKRVRERVEEIEKGERVWGQNGEKEEKRGGKGIGERMGRKRGGRGMRVGKIFRGEIGVGGERGDRVEKV